MKKNLILFFLIFGFKNFLAKSDCFTYEKKIISHNFLINKLFETKPDEKYFDYFLNRLINFSAKSIVSNQSNISEAIKKSFYKKIFQKILGFFC